MKCKILLCFSLVLSAVAIYALIVFISQQSPIVKLSGAEMSSAALRGGNDIDKHLTKQISGILTECQKIKPGMTRAELLIIFTTEGGIFTAVHRTFVYRGCPYIKVDVDFTVSDPKQKGIEERPTDIINKVSKPYLEWSLID
jgi:hypothetical protein